MINGEARSRPGRLILLKRRPVRSSLTRGGDGKEAKELADHDSRKTLLSRYKRTSSGDERGGFWEQERNKKVSTEGGGENRNRRNQEPPT